MVTKNTIE